MRRLEGEFTVQARPKDVLDYCADLRNVLPALPGLAEVKEAATDSGVIVVNAGVSFVRGRFTVRLEQTERTENGMRFRGHGDGAGSAVDFESQIDVVPANGNANVHWVSEVRVHGPLASMASGLINPVINQNVELFVGNLKKGLEGKCAAPVGETAPTTEIRQQASFIRRLRNAILRLFGLETKR
jgi:carbon monoxide dehydrogenase subunit G